MKKTIVLTVCIAAAAVCAIAAYNRAAGSDTSASGEPATQEGTAAVNGTAGKSGKVLVAYFSVPETDGVDASSGASRIVSNGRTMGSTHYVASVISEATGGDLFEIKTTTPIPARTRP